MWYRTYRTIPVPLKYYLLEHEKNLEKFWLLVTYHLVLAPGTEKVTYDCQHSTYPYSHTCIM